MRQLIHRYPARVLGAIAVAGIALLVGIWWTAGSPLAAVHGRYDPPNIPFRFTCHPPPTGGGFEAQGRYEACLARIRDRQEAARATSTPGPPTATASWHTVTYPDLAFSVALPESLRPWHSTNSDFIHASDGRGSIHVQVGGSDGAFHDCEPFGSPCADVHLTSPADLATLVADVQPAGERTQTSGWELDGAQAMRVTIALPWYTVAHEISYTLALSNGRPYLIRQEIHGAPPPGVYSDILASFRFLDDPSPVTVDLAPSTLLLFTNAVDGYELTLPSSWGDGSFSGPNRRAGVMTFGTGAKVFLTIRVGDPNGLIYLCRRRPAAMLPRCADATIRSLGEFAGTLVSAPEQIQMPLHHMTEVQADTILGGEPGMIERFDAGAYLSGPPAYYNVFTIHNGRPIVLSFEGWSVRRGEIPDLNAIIDSFRFLD